MEKQRVYFDNAASTPMDKAVVEAMLPYLFEFHGNPSSIHSHGREARNAIEKSRKTIAQLLNTSPSEIVFTSSGTESDNTAIAGSVKSLQVKHIITSPIEHHAVLHAAEALEKQGKVSIHYVQHLGDGSIDYAQLEDLIKTFPGALVSIMHGNNEIGNINDIHRIGLWCSQNSSYFHSDTVQTMGHFKFDLEHLPIDFLVASAHKFHGPKGVGFLYINAKNQIEPFVYGGSQERNMRGGTENVAGIVGMAKALELSLGGLESHEKHISYIKSHFIHRLKQTFKDILFNGRSESLSESLSTVLNVSFPASDINDMVLFNLDIHKISVSGGSACNSGATVESHVLDYLKVDPDRAHIRFSFGRQNSVE
ncbi:MAG: cysteine desulfurase, partial [Cytophagales bacterium]|nr:cysteine desulfurase [Cytophagales bacterium]